jgi:hypothetical protein
MVEAVSALLIRQGDAFVRVVRLAAFARTPAAAAVRTRGARLRAAARRAHQGGDFTRSGLPTDCSRRSYPVELTSN